MNKSVDATHEHFNSVRTGRAAPSMFNKILVDYYGTPTPVPRPSLDILPARPTRWAVVPRPARSARLPLTWGARYGVCKARFQGLHRLVADDPDMKIVFDDGRAYVPGATVLPRGDGRPHVRGKSLYVGDCKLTLKGATVDIN